MTDIKIKALSLLNEVRAERGWVSLSTLYRTDANVEALCRAIERHEAFKQKASDAAEEYNEAAAPMGWEGFDRFIIHKPKSKSDALVEALVATDDLDYEPQAEAIRATLDFFDLEIREKSK